MNYLSVQTGPDRPQTIGQWIRRQDLRCYANYPHAEEKIIAFLTAHTQEQIKLRHIIVDWDGGKTFLPTWQPPQLADIHRLFDQ